MATDVRALAGPTRPLGSPEIPQFHLPGRREGDVYLPWLYGAARIHFVDRKRKFDETKRVAYRVRLDPQSRTVDWDQAIEESAMPEDLVKDSPVRAGYLPLPAGAMELNVFTRWAKSLDRWLARTQRLDVPAPADTPGAEPVRLGPKRGGVSLELVAIVWELT